MRLRPGMFDGWIFELGPPHLDPGGTMRVERIAEGTLDDGVGLEGQGCHI